LSEPFLAGVTAGRRLQETVRGLQDNSLTGWMLPVAFRIRGRGVRLVIGR